MNYSQKRDLILHGNLYKVILLLSGPIMLNNFIQTIYNLTDTYFISWLGDIEVAAIQFVWPLIFLMLSLGAGLSMGATGLISQHVGAGNQEEASRISGQLLLFSFKFSFIVSLIGYLATPAILSLMGAEGALYDHASSYLRIMFLGAPTTFMFFAFNAIKQGEGDTMTPMKLSAISIALNIILDPIFMFVLDLEVAGAAIATVISRGLLAIYAIYYLVFKGAGIKPDFNGFKSDYPIIKSILKVGAPTAIGQSTTSVGFAIMNIFILSFGSDTLTSFAIGNRISSLVFMPAMGIGNAISAIVGQNIGAGQFKRAKEAFYKSLLMAFSIMLVLGLSMYPFSESLVKVFSDNAFILAQGTLYLQFILLTLPLMGFYQTLIGFFVGSGNTVLSMSIMMGRLWVLRIPMILLLKTYTDLGPKSIWYAMIGSNFIIVTYGMILFVLGTWKKSLLKEQAA